MEKNNLIHFLKEISLLTNSTFIKSSLCYYRSYIRCNEYGTSFKWPVEFKEFLADKENEGLIEYLPFLKLYSVIGDDNTPDYLLFDEDLFYMAGEDEVYITPAGANYLYMLWAKEQLATLVYCVPRSKS